MANATLAAATTAASGDGAPEAAPDSTPTRPAVPVPAEARPGYCSDHPTTRLVAPRRLAGWDTRRQAIACPSADHDPYTRDRCMYCGRALFQPGQGATSNNLRRLFDTATCRNYLFRRRARGLQ